MAKLSDKDKIIALALLHEGKTPREVEEQMPNVSYAQAIRLRKELEEARENKALNDLFNLDSVALESLLDRVQNDIETITNEIEGELMPVDETMKGIKNRIDSQKILEEEISKTGIKLVKRIGLMADTTNTSETLVDLARAIADLQTAFFKNNQVNIANFGDGKFEEFLSK